MPQGFNPPASARSRASIYRRSSLGLAGDDRRDRTLVFLQAFVDESFDDDIYVMAGWLAPADRWSAFANEWQQFLDMKPSIQILKMNDAMSLSGEFRWWRKEARDEKLLLLSRCISEYAILAFSCYMPHRAYMESVHVVDQEPKSSAYGFMLTTLVKEIAHHQTMLGINAKIDFIFDNQVMEQEEIRRDWGDFKRCNPEIEHLIGDKPEFKDDLYWKPLQAADLLAWLVRNKLRHDAGLPHCVDQPEMSINNKVPMISFEWNEEGLRYLRFKMECLKPLPV
jgi:hypothetical protein